MGRIDHSKFVFNRRVDKMKLYLITVILLFFEATCCFGRTISGYEVQNSPDIVFEVKNNKNTRVISIPTIDDPTVRELEYYRISEKVQESEESNQEYDETDWTGDEEENWIEHDVNNEIEELDEEQEDNEEVEELDEISGTDEAEDENDEEYEEEEDNSSEEVQNSQDIVFEVKNTKNTRVITIPALDKPAVRELEYYRIFEKVQESKESSQVYDETEWTGDEEENWIEDDVNAQREELDEDQEDNRIYKGEDDIYAFIEDDEEPKELDERYGEKETEDEEYEEEEYDTSEVVQNSQDIVFEVKNNKNTRVITIPALDKPAVRELEYYRISEKIQESEESSQVYDETEWTGDEEENYIEYGYYDGREENVDEDQEENGIYEEEDEKYVFQGIDEEENGIEYESHDEKEEKLDEDQADVEEEERKEEDVEAEELDERHGEEEAADKKDEEHEEEEDKDREEPTVILTRRRRNADYSAIPEAPQLQALDLESLPEYIKVLYPSMKSEMSTPKPPTPKALKNQNNHEPEDNELRKQIDHKIGDIFSTIPQRRNKDGVPNSQDKPARTYGMKLSNNNGYVWNDLTEPSVSYTIGDHEPRPNIADYNSDNSKEVIKPETTTEHIATNHETTDSVTGDATSTTKPNVLDNKDLSQKLEDIFQLLEELKTTESPVKEKNHSEEIPSDIDGNKYQPYEKEDKVTNIEEGIKKNTTNDKNNEKESIVGDKKKEKPCDDSEKMEESKNNEDVDEDVKEPINSDRGEEDNEGDQIEKEENYVTDNEGNKAVIKGEITEAFKELMNNEQFWKWLGNWTSSYVEMLMQRIGEFVKDEVALQIPAYLEAHKDQFCAGNDKEKQKDSEDNESFEGESEEAPMNEDNEEVSANDTEESEDVEEDVDNVSASTKKRKEDTKDETNAISNNIEAATVYSNSVGTNNITNIFVFYTNKKPEEVMESLSPVTNANNPNAVNAFIEKDKVTEEPTTGHSEEKEESSQTDNPENQVTIGNEERKPENSVNTENFVPTENDDSAEKTPEEPNKDAKYAEIDVRSNTDINESSELTKSNEIENEEKSTNNEATPDGEIENETDSEKDAGEKDESVIENSDKPTAAVKKVIGKKSKKNT